MADSVENDSAERPALQLPTDAKAMLLAGIFSLLLMYALYMTGEILVPILIAFLLKFLFQPVVETMVDYHLPRSLAALLVVGVLLGGVSGLAALLSAPAAGWVSGAPKNLAKLEKRLDGLSSVARDLQKASRDVEKMGDDDSAPAVAVKGPPLSTFLFSGTKSLLASVLTVVVLLFFLLVSGNSFLRRIVEILPTLHDKKRAVEIINEIQRTIAVYLGTVTMMNLIVGCLTGLACWLCGLSDPLLWGSVAFLLNYIPILGPMAGVALLALVGLTLFDDIWKGLLPAGIYLSLHFAEGEVITPMLLARQFTLNPVIVVMALIFWYWMWGVPGALLAVPMLAVAKIVCDRIDRLKAVGHFMGTEARELRTPAAASPQDGS
jgi:predicted PurR-regulated permease PerM